MSKKIKTSPSKVASETSIPLKSEKFHQNTEPPYLKYSQAPSDGFFIGSFFVRMPFAFTIGRKIALPFFFILLMMVVTIILTTKSYNAQINNYSYQREEALKQGVIANLRFSMATLIMHAHDYIITEKVDYNHKFKLQRIQVEDYQKKLQAFKLSKEELIIVNAIIVDLDSVYLYSNRIFAIQHPGSSSDAAKLMEIMDDSFVAPLYRNITKIFNLSAHKIELLASKNIQTGKEMGNNRYIVFMLSLFISLGVVFVSIQKITKPIKVLTKVAESISKGNYTLRPIVLSRDEIGTLALSFSKMAQTIQESINTLKESEEQYRHLFETTSDLIQTMTPDGKILFVNRAWSEKLGYTEEDLTSLKLGDIIQHDLFSKYDVAFQKALEGQRTDNLNFKLIKHNGEIIDVEGNIFCNLKEGMPATVACFLRDVTEQKKAEGQLKFHANLLNEIDEAVIATRHNGDITYWNKAAEKLYGWNETEVTGQNILDVTQPSVTNEDTALIMASLDNGESWSGEFICQRKNGSTFSAIVYYSPISDAHGKLIGIITISSDITKRKQSEELALKLSRAIEQSPVSIIITDLKGTIEYANPKVTEITGYQHSELIGQNPRILSSGNKSKEDYSELWQTISNGNEWFGELLNKKKNGELYWEYASISPIIDVEGKMTHYLAVKEDITVKKKLATELIEAKEKAEESDRLKSAFLANMSHEIRTPMNGILSFSDLLKTPNLSGEKQQQYIRVIEKSGVRMLNIINDIVSISKIESGLMLVNLEESNINEQMEYVYTFFKPEAEAKGITLSFKNSLPLKEAIIKTDREKLFTILTNLVKNAIKYTEKGTIKFGYILKKDTEPVEVEFYVKDSGIGVPIDRQEAIFERFIQADISDKMARQGAGLGLSITKAYVEMLGGQLWLESVEGKGSTFYFTLPYQNGIITEEIAKMEVLSPIEISSTKKLNILIVDDDETSRWLLEEMLENLGKKVLYAENGLEAVEICRNNPDIDLILMDIRMPIMDGYEAARQIRQFNKKSVIIAQTAFSLEGDRETAIEAGCNEHLSKPITQNILFSLIKEYFVS